MENYIVPSMSANVPITEDLIVWYVVAIIILVALAVTIVAACILFCEAKGKSFSGTWSYTNGGGSVKIGCN
ncbi:MAG: hypothetical protein ACERKZ_20150 [Lachnotalea sp.]